MDRKKNIVYCLSISYINETTKTLRQEMVKRILNLNVFLLQSSSEDTDSKRIKKLAKELLALERAYALLQAHVGSAVDAERDEMVITCISSPINSLISLIYLSLYFNESVIFPPA